LDPRQALLECFPDLADEPVTLVESGLDSVVLDVAGVWIVRVPRRPNIEANMVAEAALLAEIADRLPVPVPRPELSSSAGVRAMLYRKLPGTGVDEHLTGADRLELAGRLGEFLGELHAFPAERVKEVGVRAYDAAAWHEGLQTFYSDARRSAFPFLAADERRRATDFIERRLEDDTNVEFTLMHGDLEPQHILCDGGQVTGVIDWTDARVGDPAVDLAWVVHGTDREFADAVLDRYPGGDPTLLERARFYYRIVPWHVLIFGVAEGREDLIASGLRGVRKRLD